MCWGPSRRSGRSTRNVACEKQRPSDVTGVWFCNGQAIYDHPPGFVGRFGYNREQDGVLLTRGQPANQVSFRVPPGLPPHWLAPDPRHGAVVGFTDEYDSHGTHVTARMYVDGYAVIETLSPSRVFTRGVSP